MKKLLLASLSAAVITVGLAGCSASDATPKPTPSASEASTDPRAGDTTGAVENNDKCVDGLLRVIDAERAKPALAEGCDTVDFWVTAVSAKIGPVGTLSIIGSNSTIEVESVDTIEIDGTNNAVTYGGDEPAGIDAITDNIVTAEQ